MPSFAGCGTGLSLLFRDSSPPDLSDCTRIEIRYLPSTLDYFFRGQDVDNLLTPAEKKYIQSLETFVVTDPRRIEAFAHDISLGTLHGLLHGKPDYEVLLFTSLATVMTSI